MKQWTVFYTCPAGSFYLDVVAGNRNDAEKCVRDRFIDPDEVRIDATRDAHNWNEEGD